MVKVSLRPWMGSASTIALCSMIHLNSQLPLIFANYTVATSFGKLFKSLIWAKFAIVSLFIASFSKIYNFHHNLASLNQFWQSTHGVINSLEK